MLIIKEQNKKGDDIMNDSGMTIFAEIKKLDTLNDLLSTAGSKVFDDFSREPLEIAGTVLLLNCSYVSMVRILSFFECDDNDDLISDKMSLGLYLTHKQLIGKECAVWFDKLDALHAGMDDLFGRTGEKGSSDPVENEEMNGEFFTDDYKMHASHSLIGERANDDSRNLSEELFHIPVEDIYYLADNSFSMISGLKNALLALPEFIAAYSDN